MKELPRSSRPGDLAPSVCQLIQFVWLRSQSHLPYQKLSANIAGVIGSYFPPSLLFVGYARNKIKIFSYTTDHYRVHPRPNLLQNDHIICMIDSITALCLGAYPASTAVFYLNLLTVTVTPAPNMSVIREDPALIKYGDSVFAFGGFDGWEYLITCEVFSIGNKTWRPIPDMLKAGCPFPPAIWKLEVYLPHYDYVQVYEVHREVFRLIRFGKSLLSHPLLFILDGELFLLTQEKLLNRFRPPESNEAKLTQTVVQCDFPHFAIPTAVPVIADRMVIWVTRLEMKLLTFNADTWNITVK